MKQGMVEHTSNLSTWVVEEGGSESRGYLSLAAQKSSRASLSYTRTCLKGKKKRKKGSTEPHGSRRISVMTSWQEEEDRCSHFIFIQDAERERGKCWHIAGVLSLSILISIECQPMGWFCLC